MVTYGGLLSFVRLSCEVSADAQVCRLDFLFPVFGCRLQERGSVQSPPIQHRVSCGQAPVSFRKDQRDTCRECQHCYPFCCCNEPSSSLLLKCKIRAVFNFLRQPRSVFKKPHKPEQLRLERVAVFFFVFFNSAGAPISPCGH